MKYGKLTLGQVEAFINSAGGEEKVLAILRGEKVIRLEDTRQTLFDKNGRRIPTSYLKGSVRDPYRFYELYYKGGNLGDRIQRLHTHLKIDTGISARRLSAEARRLSAIVKADPYARNIMNGVCLPIILPKLTVDDIGTELKKYVDSAYASSGFSQEGHCYDKPLADGVDILEESRYDQVVELTKRGPVIALYFPNPLQGFSDIASREQMLALPKGFVLSGPDVAIGITMYPDILTRHCSPDLNMDALRFKGFGYSPSFMQEGPFLFFGYHRDWDSACYKASGGLLFIG